MVIMTFFIFLRVNNFADFNFIIIYLICHFFIVPKVLKVIILENISMILHSQAFLTLVKKLTTNFNLYQLPLLE